MVLKRSDPTDPFPPTVSPPRRPDCQPAAPTPLLLPRQATHTAPTREPEQTPTAALPSRRSRSRSLETDIGEGELEDGEEGDEPEEEEGKEEGEENNEEEEE